MDTLSLGVCGLLGLGFFKPDKLCRRGDQRIHIGTTSSGIDSSLCTVSQGNNTAGVDILAVMVSNSTNHSIVAQRGLHGRQAVLGNTDDEPGIAFGLNDLSQLIPAGGILHLSEVDVHVLLILHPDHHMTGSATLVGGISSSALVVNQVLIGNNGETAEDQIAVGSVVRSRQVGIRALIPCRSVVPIGIIQSIRNGLHDIGTVSLQIADTVKHQNIRIRLQEHFCGGIDVLDHITAKAAHAQSCNTHFRFLKSILEGAQFSENDLISVLIEGDFDCLDISVTDDVQRFKVTQATVLFTEHQIVPVNVCPCGGPHAHFHISKHGIERGRLTTLTMVRNLQDIGMQFAAHQREVEIKILILRGVAHDHDFLIRYFREGYTEIQRHSVGIAHMHGEEILIAYIHHLYFGVTNFQNLTQMRHDPLDVIALGKAAYDFFNLIVNPSILARILVRRFQLSPHIAGCMVVQNDLLNSNFLGILALRQSQQCADMVNMVMGQEPCGNHDLAVRPLVHTLQSVVQLVHIRAITAVHHDEGAVSQSKDLSLANRVKQVDHMHLGSDAQIRPTCVGSVVVAQQVGGGENQANGIAIRTECRIICFQFCRSKSFRILVQQRNRQILYQNGIVTLDISSKLQRLGLLEAVHGVGLVQLVAGSDQSGAVGVKVIGNDFVPAQNNSAEIGVHTAQEVAEGNSRHIDIYIVHLADHGQLQGNIRSIGSSQCVQCPGSGNSGVVIPTGNHQLAVDNGDDPLVLVDQLESCLGCGIVSQANQCGLFCALGEDIHGKLTANECASLVACAAEQHINIGRGNLRTIRIISGRCLTIVSNVGGQIVAHFHDLAPQELAVLLKGDLFCVCSFVVHIVGNDRLDFGSNTVKRDLFRNREGLFIYCGKSSNGANNAQQQSGAEDQNKPSLLEDVLHTNQSNQANQRSSRRNTINDHGDTTGFRSDIIAPLTGSGGRLGSGRSRSGGRGSCRRLRGGRQGLIYGQAVVVACLRVGSQINTGGYQSTGGEGYAGREYQLCANVGYTSVGVLHNQRNADRLTCNIVRFVSSQLRSDTILIAGSGKGGSAEHANRQQENQCQKNG